MPKGLDDLQVGAAAGAAESRVHVRTLQAGNTFANTFPTDGVPLHEFAEFASYVIDPHRRVLRKSAEIGSELRNLGAPSPAPVCTDLGSNPPSY